MPLYRAFLQTLGATLLLALALACHGKGGGSASTTAVITGTVTYQRVPLVKDAQGVPTGLADATAASNLTTLPARGTYIRIYQQVEQTQPDGTKTLAWIMANSTSTTSTGTYAITVTKDRPTMVEVISTFGGGGSTINLVAEPQGINSSTGVLDRLRYGMRKAVDGTAPANNNMPASTLSGDAVVNFSVGLNDEWWLVDPAYNLNTGTASNASQAVLETSIAGRTAGLGSGSRILGIGDTIYSFVNIYGTASPSSILDLHYWPGQSEPQGSYVDYGPYDPQHFPQAFDPTTTRYHFFGSLQGGATNDDAWDEGVILPLLARNALYASNLYISGSSARTFSVPLNPLFPTGSPLTDLSPDMARIEGLADAMAANVLLSPYLADTQGTSLASLRDIRDISGLAATQKSPYSAPAIRGLAWEIILKANSIASPGTTTAWATINPLAAARFFQAPITLTNTGTDTSRDLEPLNIYSQLKRLSEGKNSAEPVDLSAVFNDTVLTALTAPFGITWPRPSTGAYASSVEDWGTDPTTSFPAVTLSMAKAVQVNGSYPNQSEGEVSYAGFSLSADKRCVLSATITPALGAGAQVDVDLPRMPRTFSFTGSGGSTGTIVIPVTNTAPYYQPVRLRLKSPSALQPDVTVTLALTPAP